MLIATSHCDPVFSFFHSLSAIQIDFHHSTSSLLSQYNFSHFIGIRSFHLSPMTCFNNYIEPIEQIDTFIRPDLCPQLRSLRLPYCSQRLSDWIFTGAFPHLKVCHLYRSKYPRIVRSFSTSKTLEAFRQLTVHRWYARDFQKILLQCPNLTSLEYSCGNISRPLIDLNSPYLSLRSLRLLGLRRFLFHNGQFNILLSLFPNLRVFRLTTDQYKVCSETVDIEKIAQCLHYHLPHLNVLELRINVMHRNRPSIYQHTLEKMAQMHPLFRFFDRRDGLLHIASFDLSWKYHSYPVMTALAVTQNLSFFLLYVHLSISVCFFIFYFFVARFHLCFTMCFSS
jgi:hypothetical protein